MGLITSRLNLEALHSARRRSQQDETLYSYSLNKNYFSNYFFMGGERFEVNDPDYLFGDNCDLNFLSCTKPHSIPYKQAQQYLISNLNSKQKAINKVSRRVNSPFSILSGRHRHDPNSRKQDAQTQTLNINPKVCSSQPSKPLVMFVNIRKETLRLVKLSDSCNPDSDQNSLNNSISISATDQKSVVRLTRKRSSLRHMKKLSPQQQQQHNSNRLSTSSSVTTTATIYANETPCPEDGEGLGVSSPPNSCTKKFESDVSSLLSATSSIRSGYSSVREGSISMHGNEVSSDEDDEDFKDALNDTTDISIREDDDEDSEKTQQRKSLLNKTEGNQVSINDNNRDIKITIALDGTSANNPLGETINKTIESSESIKDDTLDEGRESKASKKFSDQRFRKGNTSTRRLTRSPVIDNTEFQETAQSTNKVYNIEFYFDAEVDCSIRIYYFCTREITSNGITYKPQHATYKSKVYYYKKGLNQKFEQQEHTFQPYLFDEDLLIYKPLDLDGNYNSGAVFPIVIHCVALEGATPKQSHSLVATIEKSQLDDSYSIKPLKQLIFVDGVQYILQDIYGIEHKQLTSTTSKSLAPKSLGNNNNSDLNQQSKSHSLQSNLNNSNLNLNADIASLSSVDLGLGNHHGNRGSLISNQHKSLGSENTFECVICMSEERDTMLLPCRHLCLCASCAQSLRYQANSCPICRCPFRAALNLRPIQKHFSHSTSTSITASKPLVTSSSPTVSGNGSASATTIMVSGQAIPDSSNSNKESQHTQQLMKRKIQQSIGSSPSPGMVNKSETSNSNPDKYDENKRRESLTTPLLSSAPLDVVVNLGANIRASSNTITITTTATTPNTTTTTNTSPSTIAPTTADANSNMSDLEMRPLNVRWNKSCTPSL